MLEPISSFFAALQGFLSDKLKSMVASCLGALISLHFVTGLSKWEYFSTIFCGAAISQYLTVPVAQYFNLAAYEASISFLLGVFGLSLCATLFRCLREADVWGFIRSKFGG